MEKVYTIGRTVVVTKVSTAMIRNTDMGFMNGLTVVNMRGFGRMGRGRGKGSMCWHRGRLGKEYGRKINGFGGLVRRSRRVRGEGKSDRFLI
jgi:hypothetical protein